MLAWFVSSAARTKARVKDFVSCEAKTRTPSDLYTRNWFEFACRHSRQIWSTRPGFVDSKVSRRCGELCKLLRAEIRCVCDGFVVARKGFYPGHRTGGLSICATCDDGLMFLASRGVVKSLFMDCIRSCALRWTHALGIGLYAANGGECSEACVEL